MPQQKTSRDTICDTIIIIPNSLGNEECLKAFVTATKHKKYFINNLNYLP